MKHGGRSEKGSHHWLPLVRLPRSLAMQATSSGPSRWSKASTNGSGSAGKVTALRPVVSFCVGGLPVCRSCSRNCRCSAGFSRPRRRMRPRRRPVSGDRKEVSSNQFRFGRIEKPILISRAEIPGLARQQHAATFVRLMGLCNPHRSDVPRAIRPKLRPTEIVSVHCLPMQKRLRPCKACKTCRKSRGLGSQRRAPSVRFAPVARLSVRILCVIASASTTRE